MQVTRLAVGGEKLVYAIAVGRTQKYRYGRSRVVYIGSTGGGIDRIATSAAQKAREVLRLHGVDDFEVRVITCRGRRRVKTWRKLERALLLMFRQQYGEIPHLNRQGKGIRETDEFKIFARERIRKVVDELG
jgi:hypothetical protein